MQIDIKIDSSAVRPRVIIVTDRMTDEVQEIIRKISEQDARILVGFREGKATLLEPATISRIYSENGKVFALQEATTYQIRARLYELEERLKANRFVRISHSELINLNMVKSFDLRLTGTICVSLKDRTVTYVSRRYVSKIKEVLGI